MGPFCIKTVGMDSSSENAENKERKEKKSINAGGGLISQQFS